MGDITKRISRKNLNLDSTLPLTISAQYGLVDQRKFFDKQIASKKLENYLLLKNGEFAYNKSYSKDYPFGAIKRLNNYKLGVLSTLYIAFKPVSINTDYLEEYFDSTKWYKEIYKRATEGARNHGLLNISPQDFFELNLSIPNNRIEQERISKILKLLSLVITLQQRKLEQLKTIKQELIKRVFSNHNWETVRFKDIVQLNRGLTYHPSDITNNAGVRVLRSSNIQNSKLVYNHDDVFVKKNITDPQHSLRQYDILITAANGTVSLVGKHALYLYDDENQAGGFMILLHAKNLFFINCLLDSDWYKRQLARLITGGNGSIGNLKISDLQKTLVKIPKDSIQQSIGTTFYKLDQKIELKEKKVINLNNLKQFLLQNMFI
ncbi:restriction endonuclease subunit S [Lactobacillus sp. JM1]|uniref:restriction endonuclease subunit S n=1 Tax=Lactobacillus sp. JM1 TaxID=2690380 RepID=UPI00131912EB|nr:restriction endonuclease subunit S [Lactobacillus sp. JM1]QHC53299.1 restriction endonuclease subunit S [Lactobacillus sp. JM1]